MDDTEQPVGWVLLGPCLKLGETIFGQDHKSGYEALDRPFPTRAAARKAFLYGDKILTLEEARIWMTLNSL